MKYYILKLFNEYWILTLLLISHSPLKYMSNLILILLFIFLIINHLRFKMHKVELILLFAFSISFFISLLNNILVEFSLNNIFLSILLYSPILIIPLILKNKQTISNLKKNMNIFLKIQFFVVVLQYLSIAYNVNSLDIFTYNKSAGDMLAGTFLSFSTPLSVTFSLFSLIYLNEYFKYKNKQDFIYLVLSIILVFLPGAMSIVVFFLITLFIFLIIKFRSIFFNKYLILNIFIAFVLSFSIYIWQEKNFNYITYAYNKINTNNNNKPFKIELFEKVKDEIFDKFIFGVGAGNYSSRASLFASGQYLGNQFFIPITPSSFLKDDITKVYNKNNGKILIGGVDAMSMMNEPFNQYTTFISEMGLSSVIILFFTFLYIIIYSIFTKNLFLFSITIFQLMIYFTNNWNEYISFACVYWLSIFYSIKESQQND